MMRRTIRGRFGMRRATAVLEFAIIAPFLVFLVLGAVEISRGIMVAEALNDAARRGCRTGIQGNVSTATIRADATDALKDVPLSASATVTVLVNGNSNTDASAAVHGDAITVQVSVPGSAVSWTTNIFLRGDNLLSKKIVMMRQQ